MLQQKQSEISLKKLQLETDNFIQKNSKEIEQSKNQRQLDTEKVRINFFF